MSKKSDTTFAQIWLPIYKQGDDMDRCIIKKENGEVDVKESLTRYVNLLECAIQQLKDIKNAIPDNEKIDLWGDTHYIGIRGDRTMIERLHNMDLVQIDEEEFSGEEFDYTGGENDYTGGVKYRDWETLRDWETS